MFGMFKWRKEKKRDKVDEKQLREALAEKCAAMGTEYASHGEDETEYTVITIKGKRLTVKKEEITIPAIADFKDRD